MSRLISTLLLASLGLVPWLNSCAGNTSSSDATTDSQSQNTTSSETTGTTVSETTGTTASETTGTTESTDAITTGALPCPEVEPAPGSACVTGQECIYYNCQAPDYRDDHRVTCIQGAWSLTETTRICELTGNECPAIQPTPGGSCDPVATPGPCTAANPCGGLVQVYCTAGTWQYSSGDSTTPGGGGATGVTGVTGASTALATAAVGGATTGFPPVCPSTPPLVGSGCCPWQSPQFCSYSDTSTSVSSLTAVGSLTVVGTAVATTGAGTTGSAPPPTTDCLTCTVDMVWAQSTLCPNL